MNPSQIVIVVIKITIQKPNIENALLKRTPARHNTSKASLTDATPVKAFLKNNWMEISSSKFYPERGMGQEILWMTVTCYWVRWCVAVFEIYGVLEDVPEAVNSMANRIVGHVKKYIRCPEPQLIVCVQGSIQCVQNA